MPGPGRPRCRLGPGHRAVPDTAGIMRSSPKTRGLYGGRRPGAHGSRAERAPRGLSCQARGRLAAGNGPGRAPPTSHPGAPLPEGKIRRYPGVPGLCGVHPGACSSRHSTSSPGLCASAPGVHRPNGGRTHRTAGHVTGQAAVSACCGRECRLAGTSRRRGEVLRKPQDRRPGQVVVPVAGWRLEASQVLIPGLDRTYPDRLSSRSRARVWPPCDRRSPGCCGCHR